MTPIELRARAPRDATHYDFENGQPVFFKKNDYNYGLLISNFPVEDDRNKLGFCGIKVFVSGEKVFRERESEIVNTSMYNAD